MELKCTETFEWTYDAYHDKLSEEEYIQRVRKHLEKGLPGKPSWYRYRQIVSMGGSRSSKSWSILQLLKIEMMRRSRIKITVWRNIQAVCRSTVLEDFQNIILDEPKTANLFKENKQKGWFVYLPTGSKIVFEGADSISKVLGGTQHISFFNEVTEFSKEVYLQITQRTSDRVITDYNPSKDFWMEKYRYDKETKFLHSTFLNNAFCPVNIMNQILGYEPWETGSYEIVNSEVFYNGAIISPTNQPPPNIENVEKGTAHAYNWLVYGLGIGAEKPNKIYHGWNEISQNEYDELEKEEYFGVDFGARNPTAVVGVKYDGDGSFYICEQLYQPLTEIDDSLASVMQLKVRNMRKGRSLVVCDNAKEKYINQLIDANYLAVKALKGGGSVEAGIIIVQGFRIFFVGSTHLSNEYDTYSWYEDRYGKSTDLPIKDDDHLMDALRYIITYLVNYLNIPL